MDEPQVFVHDYEISLISEFPSSCIDVYYYPNASIVGGHCDCMVMITPSSGKSWIACFEMSRLAYEGNNGVYITPDRKSFSVVCRGKGYIVRSDNPQSVICIPIEPIYDVRYVVEKGLLLFVSPWEIVAYGQSGLAWETDRISLEGIEIKWIDNQIIHAQIAEGEVDIEISSGQLVSENH